MLVADVLAVKGHKVETATPETSVADAVARMREKGIGSLVITDLKGKVLSVVAERQFVYALAEYGPGVVELPVDILMTSPVPTCKPGDDIAQIMTRMTNYRARHLPVIDGNKLVGLISIGDVVKARLDETELEVRVLRDYARSH